MRTMRELEAERAATARRLDALVEETRASDAARRLAETTALTSSGAGSEPASESEVEALRGALALAERQRDAAVAGSVPEVGGVVYALRKERAGLQNRLARAEDERAYFQTKLDEALAAAREKRRGSNAATETAEARRRREAEETEAARVAAEEKRRLAASAPPPPSAIGWRSGARRREAQAAEQQAEARDARRS